MSQLYKFWFKIEKCSKLGKLVFNIMYTLSTAISVKQIQQLPLIRITLDQRGSDDNNQMTTVVLVYCLSAMGQATHSYNMWRSVLLLKLWPT